MGEAFLYGQNGQNGENKQKGAFGIATSVVIGGDAKKAKIASTYGFNSGYMARYSVIEIDNLGWIPKYIFAISLSSATPPITTPSDGLTADMAFHIDSGLVKDRTTGMVFQQFFYSTSKAFNGAPVMQPSTFSVSSTQVYQTALYPTDSYPGIPFSADKACLIVGGENCQSSQYLWFAVGE